MEMRFELIGLAILGLALVLNIIGVAIPYWFYFASKLQDQSGSINFGLWKLCYHVESEEGSAVTTSCGNFDNNKEYDLPAAFHAARSLEILAILATTAAIVVVCLKMFYKKENTRLLYLATPIPLLAGLLMIIGAIVFVVNNEVKKLVEEGASDIHLNPHAAFGLCIVSGLLSLGASPVLFFAARAIPGLR